MSDRADDTVHSHTRLSVELRVLGLLGTTWTLAFAYALAWAWLTVGLGPDAKSLPWAMILMPQFVALNVTALAVYFDMPRARWRRVQRSRRWVLPWLLAGLPSIPLAFLFVARNRRETAAPQHSTEQVEQAFHALLRLPRAVGLRFLVWAAAACIVDAVIVGHYAGWSRAEIITIALLWSALLGPIAALLAGFARVLVRPEYLRAPGKRASFRLRTDLRLRIIVGSSIASAGSVLAPLCIGYLGYAAQVDPLPAQQAQQLVQELLVVARNGDPATVQAQVEQYPGAIVRTPTARFGDPASLVDPDQLRIRVAQDGIVVSVPLGPGNANSPLAALVFAGLVISLGSVASAVMFSRAAYRDIVRASRRARAVVDGRTLAPAAPGSYSTQEIRRLMGSVDRLVRRITEANIAKYVAIEKAKEVDRLKSQFLANMSHDLRSPLNSILGFSELLLSGIDGELSSDQQQMISTILLSGRSLLQEIDDILDTAKIEASRLDLHPEPTPPATLVNRAIASAKKRARTEGLSYEVTAAAGLPPAFCDPYRTVQAIENVLLFASERMETGTIEIRLRLGKTDRGRVIVVNIVTPVQPATAEQLGRARQGFFRIPGHRGLGLGLPLAGSILELEGGALGIEDLDQGMVFSLQLCAPETRRGFSSARRNR